MKKKLFISLLIVGAGLAPVQSHGMAKRLSKAVRLLANAGTIYLHRNNKEFLDKEFHIASTNGQTEVIRLLLSHGTEVNHTDNHGRTALHYAALHGNIKTVQILINAGAHINHESNTEWTALHYAARRGHTETVDTLITAGANINKLVTRSGLTALHFAAFHGHTETAKTLINAGADPNHTSNPGWTALHYATKNGHTKTVQALIAAGADVNKKVEKTGWTALHFAAFHGHTKTAKTIIDAGANVNHIDKNGKTALDCADINKQKETKEFIENFIKRRQERRRKEIDSALNLHLPKELTGLVFLYTSEVEPKSL